MALDEPKENDDVSEISGFEFIVDKAFLEKAQPIKVDFLVNGFKLDCGLNLQSGCASSGCGSSSCSE